MANKTSLHPTRPRRLLPALTLLAATAAGITSSCNPVDRSGEQPFAPTVETSSATTGGDSVKLVGRVLTSVNSDILSTGFAYGNAVNDTLRKTVKSDSLLISAPSFAAVVDSLGAGDYYAVAFATNGVGTSYGDTIHFTIRGK